MSFTVIKTITSKTKDQPLVTKLLVMIIVIPIVIIFVLFIAAVMIILAVLSFVLRPFRRKQKTGTGMMPGGDEPIQDAIIIEHLLNNNHFIIDVETDEHDREYEMIAAIWEKQVFEMEYAPFGRAATRPVIAELNGQFITQFIKESETGFLIQVINKEKARLFGQVDTTLYFCRYADGSLTPVQQVGPYFLQKNNEQPGVIVGINRGGRIELTLQEDPGN